MNSNVAVKHMCCGPPQKKDHEKCKHWMRDGAPTNQTAIPTNPRNREVTVRAKSSVDSE